MSASSSTLLDLRNVTKDYTTGGGVVHALRELTLDVKRGEFVAIVGTSGSGKSTLMNILGCLDRPTKGTYELGGIEVGARGNDARAIVRNRLIGFIFQGFNLLPRTTALENVELPLQYRGVGARERRRRAEEALRAVGLGDRMDHTPSALSGGQQQRVAIARALVTDPPLLLADEPTGNLDTRTSLEVLALLQRLNRDRGITIALVTHEHDIAECASRVITFRDGRMVDDIRQHTPLDAAKALAELPPTDLRESPKDDSAALGEAKLGGHLGGPVPFVVYLGMFFGTLLGNVAGNAYTAVVVGAPLRWVPPLFAVVTEAWLASWVARRHLHRNLTPDQRVRVALGYTLVMTTVQGIALVVAMSALPAPMLAGLDRLAGNPLVAILVVFLLVAAQTLLRYLLLSLSTVFGGAPPRVRA